jgi:hypothetical protein
VSFWLHVVGIPLTIFGVVVAVFQLYHGMWDDWWRPFVFWIVGYAMQWIGHVHEGNDMGEVILFKRLLGKPFVAVSPRYAKSPGSTADCALAQRAGGAD